VSDLTHRPSALSTSLAVLAASASLLATGLSDPAALAAGVPGVACVGAGSLRGSRRLVSLGGLALTGGVIVAGLAGGGPEVLLLGALAALVAWDVAEHGIGVGDHLGRETETARIELVHAAATLLVGVLAAGVGYGVYRGVAGGQPVTAVVFLLVGVVATVAALRRRATG